MLNKKEFKESSKEHIDQLFEKIDSYEMKGDQLSQKAKNEIVNMIADLKKKKLEVFEGYETMKHAADHKWEEAKISFEESFKRLKEGVVTLGSMFEK